MKPLTIEELKNLKDTDFVWVVSFSNPKLNTYITKISFTKKMLCGLNYNHQWRHLNLDNYGRTWSIYRNKEQAEAKGEIVELPCELGQLLYAVYDGNIHECFGAEINIHEDGRFIFETPTLFPKRLTFGEDIFTNKSEAERRLAELKGEKQ